MVEPYMVEKIKYADTHEDYGVNADSIIKKNKDTQVFKESVARQVTNGMIAVVDNPASGLKPLKDATSGYTIAAKTGTAEKNTTVNGVLCNYSCNREKGLYEQTIVGFNANSENPILILVKLDEPNPGSVNSFSGATIGASFGEMMRYTLDYLGIKGK
jgi:cell division protein FtsI/penicillin-binding protein 2